MSVNHVKILFSKARCFSSQIPVFYHTIWLHFYHHIINECYTHVQTYIRINDCYHGLSYPFTYVMLLVGTDASTADNIPE